MDGGETARARGGFRARAPGLRCAWPAGDAAHRQFRPDHAAALLQARAQPEGQPRRVPLRAAQRRRRPRRKVMTAADLFGRAEPVAPLADALRPKTVDEVHRFNKAQQDAFLPYVEQGLITFVGATTENPSFEMNSALLSRATVYVLEPLRREHLALLLARTGLNVDEDAKARLIGFAD